MAALLRSKVLIPSNWKVLACQISLNEDSFLHSNSLSLLVEVPPSSKAPRLTPSLHLNQLHRETSKQQQQQKHPRKWLQQSGEFRADQRRRVRLESAVVWEQRVLVILAHNFASLISFFSL